MTRWHECPPLGLPPGSRQREGRLDNGLRVVLAQVPGARQARLALGIGVGYLDEPDAWPGLAHLLEHALFLDAPGETPGGVAAWVSEWGGRYNARTDDEVTDVHFSLPWQAAEEGVARLLALVARPHFRPPAIDREVAVLDAEFRARLGDPALHRQMALSRLCRPDHPAFHCHAGNRDSLGTTPGRLCQALQAFHHDHYRAGRMVLAVLAPQPLAEQQGWVEAAQGLLAEGGTPRPPSWRWGAAAGVRWVAPGAAHTLELIWPLPPTAPLAWGQALARLAAALNDGRLAATLGRRGWLTDLVASPDGEATGRALSLRLTLSEAGRSHGPRMIATCQRAVSELAAQALPAPPTPAIPLADWAREWVRQRCRQAAWAVAATTESAARVAEGAGLSEWLSPANRRLLASLDELPASAPRVAATGTPYAPWDGGAPASAWGLPLGAAPLTPGAGGRSPKGDGASGPGPLAGVLAGDLAGDQANAPGGAWWQGGGPAGLAAGLCLAWPAAPGRQGARLAAWHRQSLALRQAAASRGVTLRLECGARDGLAIAGPGEWLEGLARGLLATWPRQAGPEAPAAVAGLAAQRLLGRLAEPPVVGGGEPGCLGWHFGLDEALARRLAPLLPRPCETPKEGEAYKEAAAASGREPWREGAHAEEHAEERAGERAVMLQVEGDDDPLMRLYLRLLAQCHDAAFFHEMRGRRRLGYVAAVRYGEAAGRPRLGYVVQSPHAGSEALQEAIVAFLQRQGRDLAVADEARFARHRLALEGQCGLPETPTEAWLDQWQGLRRGVSEPPHQATRAALARLEPDGLIACAEALTRGQLAWRWWSLQGE